MWQLKDDKNYLYCTVDKLIIEALEIKKFVASFELGSWNEWPIKEFHGFCDSISTAIVPRNQQEGILKD